MEHHQIISKSQSGFRANHSTETSLLHITNSWLANMDAGLINGVLFLDLKKAFDTVNHKILLSKLGCYGIRGLAQSSFQSCLSNWKQICKVNNSVSTFQNITCGIPLINNSFSSGRKVAILSGVVLNAYIFQTIRRTETETASFERGGLPLSKIPISISSRALLTSYSHNFA